MPTRRTDLEAAAVPGTTRNIAQLDNGSLLIIMRDSARRPDECLPGCKQVAQPGGPRRWMLNDGGTWRIVRGKHDFQDRNGAVVRQLKQILSTLTAAQKRRIIDYLQE